LTKDLLIFDVWAPFGFFRRSETTTTSVTYSLMPRSAAEGLVGAILGLNFDDSPTKLATARIAIGIQSPVRKIPFSATYTDTKEIWPRLGAFLDSQKASQKSRRKVEFRTRVKMEMLHEPHYRVYFDHPSQEIKNELEDKLAHHKTAFTPYLGSSSMIANFSYIGRPTYETADTSDPIAVSSAVPFFGRMPRIHLRENVTFAVEENLPIHLTSERALHGTYNAVYSPTGAELEVLDIEAQRVSTHERELHVVFVPTESTPE
jgi:CRISPR-associated protein Cas5h